jgi:tetratricopeptide (TPR) repeat protein
MPALPQRTRLEDAVTVRFAVPLDEDTVPYLTVGIDIALQPLPPFEAYVASFIDGNQTVAALAREAKLPEIEIKVVLKSLFDRHFVELHRQPAPASPEEALPLLNGADFLEEEAPPPPPAPPRAQPPLPRIPFLTPPPVARKATESPAPTRPPVQAPLVPPPERTEDFLQRVVRLEREGQVDRAIELLKRGLEKFSAAAPLYNKLALILVSQRKDYLQATELLERAVGLEPNNPVFQQNLLKVVSLAASAPGARTKKQRGLLDRLTRRGS